ncbi:MAG TPA: aminotransferase class I/II-fold pyridoxal phosphate-dependent enzyme [Polyangiaceae bacterium]|jgi:aromatic-amino-acid transaminase
MLHLIAAHQGRPGDDPIFALNKEASDRRARGEIIVNATVGALLDDAGKLAVLPTAARAVHEVPPAEWAAYAPISGLPDFLRAATDDLLGRAPRLRECAVAAGTPGGSGALHHAIKNFLEPGQTLLTTNFFWGPYQTLADESDRKLATFDMFAPDPAAALDRALGAIVAEQKRALLFINDPCHNPTGYSMTDEEWQAFLDVIASHGKNAPVTLLIDVAYADYGARDFRGSLGRFEKVLDRVQILFAYSASKAFTHYGLRVGAIVACTPDAKERASIDAAFGYSCRGTWSNCVRGGQRAVTRLLTDPELSAAVKAERDDLKSLLLRRVAAFNARAKDAKLRYPRYEGGFFVTVFCEDGPKEAARMREIGVYVVPQKKAVRVALCGVSEADIPRLVEALAPLGMP